MFKKAAKPGSKGARSSPRGGPKGGSRGGSRFGSRDGGSGGGRPDFRDGERGGRPDRGGRIFRKKVCRLCKEDVSHIDYKEVEKLAKFLSEKGKIAPRRISGNCAKHQRMLAGAIKRSRHSALVAFQVE